MSMMTLEKDTHSVYFGGKTYSYKDMIRAVPGAAWSRKRKRWEIPLEAVEDTLRIMPYIGVSEDVQTGFEALKEKQEAMVAVKDADVSGEVSGLKGQLYPYQASGLAFLRHLGGGDGAILAFDMGLGKSLTSLAYAVELFGRGEIDHMLVVCPAKLKYATWAAEIEKWTDLTYQVIDGDRRETVEWEDGTTERLTGAKLREVQYMQAEFGAQVLVMNYELFLRDMDIMPNITGRWLVVLDESHRIKSPKSKTTKNLMKKLRPAGRKVLATGTPMENNIQELWTLVDFCRPGLLGTHFRFIERYVETDFFGSPVAPKPQMLPELIKKLEPIMIRKSKKEALPDLPPLTVIDRPVPLTKAQSDLYKQVKEGIIEVMKEQGPEFTYLEALAQLTRIQQLCDSPALLRTVFEDDTLPEESGKLDELEHILSEIDLKEEQFILFSQYSSMTDLLFEWLVRKGIVSRDEIGYVKGGIKAERIEEVRKGFADGKFRCVLMTTAGNYGLNLQSASYVICFDQLFNPQQMEQIYARAHRNGAQKPVTAINLISSGTYEEKKMEILQAKRDLFDAVIEADAAVMGRLFGSPSDMVKKLL